MHKELKTKDEKRIETMIKLNMVRELTGIASRNEAKKYALAHKMLEQEFGSDQGNNADAQSLTRSEFTHRSVSPNRRATTPVKQANPATATKTQPLQSALKKKNVQDLERATSAGGFSDAKSFERGRADSPLKQAQFNLEPPMPPQDGMQKH